jgi:hypothetical protein
VRLRDSLILVDDAAEDRLPANRSVERDDAGGGVVGVVIALATRRCTDLARSPMPSSIRRIIAKSPNSMSTIPRSAFVGRRQS